MFDRIQSFGARRMVVVVLAAGLVGVVAVPSILAASAPPTVAQVGQPAPVAAAKPGAFGRVLRGDATILKRDGTTTTVHFERGEITAASATSVTIKGADGVSKTFAIGPDTRIRSQGKKTTTDALKVGAFAAVFGTNAGSSTDALLIRIRAAKPTP
ncbi:MAG TPA: hypothetical protein VLR93_00750 [Patescibacteria group bacterium]|nr:hypothetical protein [Patescibacteria group bacterium]